MYIYWLKSWLIKITWSYPSPLPLLLSLSIIIIIIIIIIIVPKEVVYVGSMSYHHKYKTLEICRLPVSQNFLTGNYGLIRDCNNRFLTIRKKMNSLSPMCCRFLFGWLILDCWPSRALGKSLHCTCGIINNNTRLIHDSVIKVIINQFTVT
mgnify:CR=1 FL=1